jgi:hypothetical protein
MMQICRAMTVERSINSIDFINFPEKLDISGRKRKVQATNAPRERTQETEERGERHGTRKY